MKNIKNIWIITLIMVALIITQTSCSREVEPTTKTNYMLDTTCTVSIYEMVEGGDKEAQEAIDKSYDLCASLEKKLSRTLDTSDISKLNKAGGEWVEVSEDTIDVVKGGIKYSELSGGIFDISIGGVTDLWDFHSEKPVVPEADKLSEAVSHVDYKNIMIDGNMLRLADPKAKIDLGGIAKGYIGDRMVELLEEEGVTSGIVNLGGNVICIGSKPNSEGFNIGIEAPVKDKKDIIGSVKAADKTLVTSGVYERAFTADGKTYHHILSTETGYPVNTDLKSVTLIAEKGHSMDIDAMSTICLIKGYKEGMKFIGQMDGIDAIFILSDGTIKQTDGVDMEK